MIGDRREWKCTNYNKYPKILNTFLLLFKTKMLFIRAESPKNAYLNSKREDPDQTASSGGVWSGSALFVYAFLAGIYCSKF